MCSLCRERGGGGGSRRKRRKMKGFYVFRVFTCALCRFTLSLRSVRAASGAAGPLSLGLDAHVRRGAAAGSQCPLQLPGFAFLVLQLGGQACWADTSKAWHSYSITHGWACSQQLPHNSLSRYTLLLLQWNNAPNILKYHLSHLMWVWWWITCFIYSVSNYSATGHLKINIIRHAGLPSVSILLHISTTSNPVIYTGIVMTSDWTVTMSLWGSSRFLFNSVILI